MRAALPPLWKTYFSKENMIHYVMKPAGFSALGVVLATGADFLMEYGGSAMVGTAGVLSLYLSILNGKKRDIIFSSLAVISISYALGIVWSLLPITTENRYQFAFNSTIFSFYIFAAWKQYAELKKVWEERTLPKISEGLWFFYQLLQSSMSLLIYYICGLKIVYPDTASIFDLIQKSDSTILFAVPICLFVLFAPPIRKKLTRFLKSDLFEGIETAATYLTLLVSVLHNNLTKSLDIKNSTIIACGWIFLIFYAYAFFKFKNSQYFLSLPLVTISREYYENCLSEAAGELPTTPASIPSSPAVVSPQPFSANHPRVPRLYLADLKIVFLLATWFISEVCSIHTHLFSLIQIWDFFINKTLLTAALPLGLVMAEYCLAILDTFFAIAPKNTQPKKMQVTCQTAHYLVLLFQKANPNFICCLAVLASHLKAIREKEISLISSSEAYAYLGITSMFSLCQFVMFVLMKKNLEAKGRECYYFWKKDKKEIQDFLSRFPHFVSFYFTKIKKPSCKKTGYARVTNTSAEKNSESKNPYMGFESPVDALRLRTPRIGVAKPGNELKGTPDSLGTGTHVQLLAPPFVEAPPQPK